MQSQARATASTPRTRLARRVLVLDETPMVAKEPMRHLVGIANVLWVERLPLIGDCPRIQPTDTDKAYSLIQSNGVALARMDMNLRQRTDQLRTVAALTNGAGRRQHKPQQPERRSSLGMVKAG